MNMQATLTYGGAYGFRETGVADNTACGPPDPLLHEAEEHT